jgi:hypothetical protein
MAVRLRQEGMSYRQIGERLGVSHEAARQDVGRAGVNDLTPETVTGRDGKTYPAQRDYEAEAVPT